MSGDSKHNIYKHSENVHGISIKLEHHHFDCIHEFNAQKQEN